MWIIEDEDKAGEGLFICEAPTKAAALAMHEEHCKGIKVVSVERSAWISLAFEGHSYQRRTA